MKTASVIAASGVKADMIAKCLELAHSPDKFWQTNPGISALLDTEYGLTQLVGSTAKLQV